MVSYRVVIKVKEVIGKCAAGYKPGDMIIVENFYILPLQHNKICLHALNSMLNLLMPFLKGISAKKLGIGNCDSVGYIRCPDPGPPYTSGGSVIFELRREEVR